jgi:hypothetical protein
VADNTGKLFDIIYKTRFTLLRRKKIHRRDSRAKSESPFSKFLSRHLLAKLRLCDSVRLESHFSTKFSATENRAGLTHLHFTICAVRAITVLAENGCTNSEVAFITSHSMKHIEKVIDTYMARTRKLNDEAVAKLERSWIASVGAIE